MKSYFLLPAEVSGHVYKEKKKKKTSSVCGCLLCEQEPSLDPWVDPGGSGAGAAGSLASSQSSQIGKIQVGLMKDCRKMERGRR